jgi:hypothetical protein
MLNSRRKVSEAQVRQLSRMMCAVGHKMMNWFQLQSFIKLTDSLAREFRTRVSTLQHVDTH